MIWMAAVMVDRDSSGDRDNDDSDDENNEMVKMVETAREAVDNGNRW
jgi:hypothetical protein